MNTFQQLKDKEVLNILRITGDKDLSSDSFLVAVLILLELNSGLLISFDCLNETTQISFATIAEVQEEFGTEYSETNLDELTNNHLLRKLLNQKIRSIKVGQFADDKANGGTFVIKSGQYAGVVIELEYNKVIFYAKETGGQILLDNEDLFPNKKNWQLV